MIVFVFISTSLIRLLLKPGKDYFDEDRPTS